MFCVLSKCLSEAVSAFSKALKFMVAFRHVIWTMTLPVNLLIILRGKLAHVLLLNCSDIPGDGCFC